MAKLLIYSLVNPPNEQFVPWLMWLSGTTSVEEFTDGPLSTMA